MIDVSQVNAENYHQYAICTEAPTGPAMERIQKEGVIQFFRGLLYDSERAGQGFDSLKKFLFYGKQTIAFDREHHLSPKSLQMIQTLLDNPQLIRLIHAFAGMQSELAEMADILIGVLFEGKQLDVVNAQEEGGDVNWYVNGLWADSLGTTAARVMRQNIDKLANVRYPEKFTELAANNRDLETERKILEEHSDASIQANAVLDAELMTEFKHVDADADREEPSSDATRGDDGHLVFVDGIA